MSSPPAHNARAFDRPSRFTDKWAWDCSSRGCFSGWRFKTQEAAERGAERHNREGAEQDNRVHRQLYGGRR